MTGQRAPLSEVGEMAQFWGRIAADVAELQRLASTAHDPWHDIAVTPPWSETVDVQYRLASDARSVIVRGRITNSSGSAISSTALPFITLPAGYRPEPTQTLVPLVATPATPTMWVVESGGNIRLASGQSVANGAAVVFDAGVTIPLD